MNTEKVAVELPSKVVLLVFEPFDTDLDTNELTQIHYHNLMGEILTSSLLLNRVGNLRAELESHHALQKLDFEIFYADLKINKRKELTTTFTDAKGNQKIDKPTLDEIEYAALTSPAYKVKMQNLLKIEKNLKIVENLYWACKSKDDKIVKLTEKLRPEEFEKDLVEERINTIQIKIREKSIK